MKGTVWPNCGHVHTLYQRFTYHSYKILGKFSPFGCNLSQNLNNIVLTFDTKSYATLSHYKPVQVPSYFWVNYKSCVSLGWKRKKCTSLFCLNQWENTISGSLRFDGVIKCYINCSGYGTQQNTVATTTTFSNHKVTDQNNHQDPRSYICYFLFTLCCRNILRWC